MSKTECENNLPQLKYPRSLLCVSKKAELNVHRALIKISVVGTQCLPSILKVLGLTQHCKTHRQADKTSTKFCENNDIE